MNKAIEASHLTYARDGGGRVVLNDISFNVNRGEYVSVLGANGAGKSTLLSCINGLLSPTSGAVLIYGADGAALSAASEEDLPLIRKISGTVLQNPDNQFFFPVVEDDASFILKGGALTEAEIAERLDAALDACGILHCKKREINTLSGGERQRLAVSECLIAGADILLLDEPLSMIDGAGRASLIALFRRLAEQGKTIIETTHSVLGRESRCIALENGALIYDGPSNGAPERKRLSIGGRGAQKAGSPCVVFNNTSYRYEGAAHDALEDFSLAVAHNESVALVGRNGGGKTTALKHINALLFPAAGRVAVLGRDTLDKRMPLNFFRRSASLALQNAEAAVFESFAVDEVAYGARCAGLKGGALLQRVKDAFNDVGLPFDEFAGRRADALSGGEARLLSIAAVLAQDAPIVLLDEPCAGLDGYHTECVFNALLKAKERGKTIVVSTHDAETADFFDRVIEVTAEKESVDKLTESKTTKNPTRKAGGEFFKKASSSFYADKDSLLHKAPPKVKLPAVFALVVLAAAVPQAWFPPAFLALVLVIGAVAGKTSPRTLFTKFAGALPVIALFICVRLLFSFQGDESAVLLTFWRVTITAYELQSTALLFFRLFAAMALLSLYAVTTKTSGTLDAVHALLSPLGKLGFPVREACLVCAITLRFIPLIGEEARLILESQLSRGAKTGALAKLSLIKTLFVPLFLRSLRRAEVLAAAMMLRGM